MTKGNRASYDYSRKNPVQMAVNLMKFVHLLPYRCVLPRTHGSGLFTRGQTQVLNVATVAPLSETQTIDGIGLETENVIFTTIISHPSP